MSDVLTKAPRRVLRRWGKKEIETAQQMRGDGECGCTLEEIATHLHRPISSVHEMLGRLKKDEAAVIEKAPEIPTSTYDPIPGWVLEDRERRYEIAPRNLTAMVMGDPLPGYSGLEVKKRKA